MTSSGRREAFPLAVVVASVGTAWLGTLFGLSMAVGAFLAGLMLAESEFSHQAYAEVRPVRDVLSGLFFISLGMLIDLRDDRRSSSRSSSRSAVAIILLKAIVAAAALVVAATPLRVAMASAIGLSQVGEFSFILGRAGLDAGLLPRELWQVMLGASVATMIVTPLLLAVAPGVAIRLSAGLTGIEHASQGRQRTLMRPRRCRRFSEARSRTSSSSGSAPADGSWHARCGISGFPISSSS